MNYFNKTRLKDILGSLPLTAELYWYMRMSNHRITGGFSLQYLEEKLPEWRRDAQAHTRPLKGAKNIALFGMRNFWLQHLSAIGLTLAGMGHRVSLCFLPFNKFDQPANVFDLRRQSLAIEAVLRLGEPLLRPAPIYPQMQTIPHLPKELIPAMEDLAFRDVQYIQQQERVSKDSELYRMRLERDTKSAIYALDWLRKNRPDVLILPNGAILEYEAVHRAARYLNIPTVTFEFFDVAERTWIAQNTDAMHQDTNALWAKRKDQPLTAEQMAELQEFFTARKGPKDANRLVIRYQGIPTQGAEKIRQELGLDDRPVVLLPTNVIGDSLTLGRQVFSETMTEWLEKTALYFASRPDLQFVVRIHPGELITKAPSVAEVVKKVLPELPEHIHLIPAEAKVNTYDLIEASSLGVVYTTTAGLEMVLSGLPVIVAGKTHYRGRGFTLDPDSWKSFFDLLDRFHPSNNGSDGDMQPHATQVDLAWNYAYRYFIEFPHPFPWHLRNFAQDMERWPIRRVLSGEGMEKFGQTFRYLAGEPVTW
jgi:hypothetical protein